MKLYASFFESHDKTSKKRGVVEELVTALNRGTGLSLRAPREFSPDPPDCICLDAEGRPVAIEVAEVVCETATRLTAQGQDVHRVWGPGELAEHVARLLHEKDAKHYHGGPYAELVACLFTDEPTLSPALTRVELASYKFGPIVQLTAAFLLFSYDPSTKSYPLIELWRQHGA